MSESSSSAARTLADNVAELLEHYNSLRSSPHTLARLRSGLRLFVDYLAGYHDVRTAEAITLAQVQGFQTFIGQRHTREGLPMKPASVNTVIKSVRVLLNRLHQQGFIVRPLSRNLAYVRLPQILPKSVLNHIQIRQLIRRIRIGAPAGIRDRAAIELLYSSGIRIGELEGLRLKDLDLERAVARVVGKGRKERFVPIGRTALKWLANYIRAVRPFLVREPTDTVFLTEAGRPMPQHLLRQRIHEYAAELEVGLEFEVTPHTFRRSCTSELIKSNANLYHVKQLLGHSSFETLNHYAKLDIADLQKTHAKCHPREKDGF
jgi:integrase/recombinase XerD